MKKVLLAAAFAAISLQAAPAFAVDIVNCTKSNLKILVFNNNDKVETIHKAKILVPKDGGSTNGTSIPGKNPHKFKIFARGVLDNHLGTIRGVDETKSYAVVGAGGGRIDLVADGSC